MRSPEETEIPQERLVPTFGVVSLNLQSTSEARNYLQLLDFVLERQTAVAGSDPWTGPWDVVDQQRALDVLAEAYDFALDPVDPRVTDVTTDPATVVERPGDFRITR